MAEGGGQILSTVAVFPLVRIQSPAPVCVRFPCVFEARVQGQDSGGGGVGGSSVCGTGSIPNHILPAAASRSQPVVRLVRDRAVQTACLSRGRRSVPVPVVFVLGDFGQFWCFWGTVCIASTP